MKSKQSASFWENVNLSGRIMEFSVYMPAWGSSYGDAPLPIVIVGLRFLIVDRKPVTLRKSFKEKTKKVGRISFNRVGTLLFFF